MGDRRSPGTAVSAWVAGTGSGNVDFFELAAWIIGSFFIAGIIVGFLVIEVLPEGGRRHTDGGDWREVPPRRDDDGPLRWPGS
jgi:hypothetical protein